MLRAEGEDARVDVAEDLGAEFEACRKLVGWEGGGKDNGLRGPAFQENM